MTNQPCPFCGGTNIHTEFNSDTTKWGYAYCADCRAQSGEVRTQYQDAENAPWRAAALREWNTRNGKLLEGASNDLTI